MYVFIKLLHKFERKRVFLIVIQDVNNLCTKLHRTE